MPSGASPSNRRSGGFWVSTSRSTVSRVTTGSHGVKRLARASAACCRTGSQAGNSVACLADDP